MSLKQAQNAQIQRKERYKLQRLTIEADIESVKVQTARVNLATARVGTAIAQTGLQGAQIKLQTAQIGNRIEGVKLGKAQDRLSYEQADRMLGQQEMRHKLELKAIQVSAIATEVAHQRVLNGGGSSRALGG